MKPKTLPVLEQCVEVGIELGMRRAYKHTDEPTDDQVKAALATAIMDQFYEWFDFPTDDRSTDDWSI